MNYEHLHDFNFERFDHLAFDALYVCVAIAIFVIIERGLYFAYLSLSSGRIARVLERDAPAAGTPVVGSPAAGLAAPRSLAAGLPPTGWLAAGTPRVGTPASGSLADGTPASGSFAAGTSAAGSPAARLRALDELQAKDPLTAAIRRYAMLQSRGGTTRDASEDYSAALFIEVDKKISARLWLLDTIVTAAPLLGLLGTILGIMETFTALAQGGISDPGEVSRGIGTALIATAIGIATALLGLFGNNILNRYADALIEDFKSYVLRIPAKPAAA